jgi:hypothetical protein
VNCQMNSQNAYYNPLFQKGIVNAPMNTIMSIGRFFIWDTITTVNNSFTQWPSADKTGILLDSLRMACLLRKARTLTENQNSKAAYNN